MMYFVWVGCRMRHSVLRGLGAASRGVCGRICQSVLPIPLLQLFSLRLLFSCPENEVVGRRCWDTGAEKSKLLFLFWILRKRPRYKKERCGYYIILCIYKNDYNEFCCAVFRVSWNESRICILHYIYIYISKCMYNIPSLYLDK